MKSKLFLNGKHSVPSSSSSTTHEGEAPFAPCCMHAVPCWMLHEEPWIMLLSRSLIEWSEAPVAAFLLLSLLTYTQYLRYSQKLMISWVTVISDL
jgi:hypothetical protein